MYFILWGVAGVSTIVTIPEGPCTQYLGTWDIGNGNYSTGLGKYIILLLLFIFLLLLLGTWTLSVCSSLASTETKLSSGKLGRM